MVIKLEDEEANIHEEVAILSYNQKYGLVVENKLKKKRHYLDVNIFNSQPYTTLYLIFKAQAN